MESEKEEWDGTCDLYDRAIDECEEALKQKEEMVFQVLNGSGNPASHREDNDLAVFSTMAEAQTWIDYLKKEIRLKDNFTIRPRILI